MVYSIQYTQYLKYSKILLCIQKSMTTSLITRGSACSELTDNTDRYNSDYFL